MNVRRNKVRINKRRNVMFDKSAFVAGFAAKRTKIIFPVRQRTKPDEILDEKTPNERGQMQFPDPAPIQNEKPAEHRKNYKAEMKN